MNNILLWVCEHPGCLSLFSSLSVGGDSLVVLAADLRLTFGVANILPLLILILLLEAFTAQVAAHYVVDCSKCKQCQESNYYVHGQVASG